MVRAVEWEKDPEPVPRYAGNFQNTVRTIENRGSGFSGGVAGPSDPFFLITMISGGSGVESEP